MKTRFYIIIVLLNILFSSCKKELGEFVQVHIDTAPFTQLVQDASTDIVLTQGPVFNIDFEGYEDILAGLDFRVINRKLIITQHGNDWYSGKSTIYITVPDLTWIEVTSSGDIYGDNRFRVKNELEIRSRASGDIDLYLDASDTYTQILGSGDVRIRGIIDYHIIDHDGSGNIYGYALETIQTRINQTGSGDSEISARNNLMVRLRGSGDIFFIGNPYLDYSVTGSGKLIDAN